MFISFIGIAANEKFAKLYLSYTLLYEFYMYNSHTKEGLPLGKGLRTQESNAKVHTYTPMHSHT